MYKRNDLSETEITLIIFISCLLLVIALVIFIAWILFVYQKKQNSFLKNLDDVRNGYEKELLKIQLELQEQVFQYLSQEIHDNVGQFISLAKLHLNTINQADIAPTASQKISYSTDLLTKALDDLRDLSKSLSADMVKEMGLEKAIDMQIEQLQKMNSFEVELATSGHHIFLDERTEVLVFRIIQEAVNNIIRHAQATKLRLELTYSQESLTISIDDNGKGFDSARIEAAENKLPIGGIRNMKKRAKLIDALFTIESIPQKGTKITLTVPINKKS